MKIGTQILIGFCGNDSKCALFEIICVQQVVGAFWNISASLVKRDYNDLK